MIGNLIPLTCPYCSKTGYLKQHNVKVVNGEKLIAWCKSCNNEFEVIVTINPII